MLGHRTTPGAQRGALVLAAVLLAGGVAHATDLTPLLEAPGDTVTLSSTTSYTVGNHLLLDDKTIVCNGAQISATGPIGIAGAGKRLVVDGCRIDGSGWSLLAANEGAVLEIRNDTRLTGNGANTAIYVKASTLDVTATTLEHFQSGIQVENADAALHAVVITDTKFAVQSFAGTVTVDACELTNLDPALPGAGVDLHAADAYPTRAASAIIRDTTFNGFGNAVSIHPTMAKGLPPATAEILRCTFNRPVISAVIAVDAAWVRFAQSRVLDAQTDGVYFENSIGLVEDSQVLNSLNTGVSFFGCPNGGTIRNSLVRGSVHQGVAVSVDPVSGRSSHGVRVVDNTLVDNVIANLLVDERSDAVVQGNVFSGGPEGSVRVHQSSSAQVFAGLFLDGFRGLEAYDGGNAGAALSLFTRHTNSAIAVAERASAVVSHCAIDGDGLADGKHAVDIVSGATITLGRSALGPAGSRALQNRAGTTSTATYDYWGDPSGPRKGGGSGAIITSRNGSRVKFDPFLAAPPVESRLERAFVLAPGTDTRWEPDLGLVLTVTGAPGITPVSGLVAALRAWDASTLTVLAPPLGTFVDGVVAVWLEFDVLSRVAGGSLRFRTAGDGAAATLLHLDGDGQWRPLVTTWDAGAGELVYATSEPKLLQGIFAFGDGRGCPTTRECLAPLVAGDPCDQPLDPRVQRAIARKLKTALAKLATAAHVPKHLAQARKALRAIDAIATKGVRKGVMTSDCRSAIGAALYPALQRLDAGAL